jgi:hypothetical protein
MEATHIWAIRMRVSVVALPRWGARTTRSCSISPGCTSGSLAAFERVHQGRLVDDGPAGGVHQQGRRLHFREGRRVEKVVALVVVGAVQRDDVARRQQLAQPHVPGAHLALHGRIGPRPIVVDHLHPEAEGAARDRRPDPPHADDADGLAGQLHAHQVGRLPALEAAVAHVPVGRRHVPGGGQQQGPRLVRRRVGQHAGRVGDGHVVRLRRLQVDVVDPDGVLRHHLQPRAGLEQRLRDRVGEHGQKHVGPVGQGDEFIDGARAAVGRVTDRKGVLVSHPGEAPVDEGARRNDVGHRWKGY